MIELSTNSGREDFFVPNFRSIFGSKSSQFWGLLCKCLLYKTLQTKQTTLYYQVDSLAASERLKELANSLDLCSILS